MTGFIQKKDTYYRKGTPISKMCKHLTISETKNNFSFYRINKEILEIKKKNPLRRSCTYKKK